MESDRGSARIICDSAFGSEEAIREIAKEFFKDFTIDTDGSNFVLKLPEGVTITKEEEQKFQELCILKSRVERIRRSQNRVNPSHHGSAGQTVSKSPDGPVKRLKPHTIRIKGIENSLEKDRIKWIVQKDFNEKPVIIHSLAAYSSKYNCATATFINEIDYNYPIQRCPSTQRFGFDYDSDFHGFTPLYDPDKKAVVDMVAIAGLGTNAFGTFRSPKAGSRDMWLRDFLPEDIPESRVLLYGYPSKVDGSKSIETIETIAGQLLNRLINFRNNTKTESRPIIFLGQSLGGLLAQECILMSKTKPNDPEHDIFKSWSGFVGFGVPCKGLNNPILLDVTGNQPNRRLMEQLCLDKKGVASRHLRDLQNRFRDCLEEIQSRELPPKLIFFWEVEESTPRTHRGDEDKDLLMVTADTTIPYAKHFFLAASHSGLVKFSSRSEAGYEDVKNAIVTLVNGLREYK